MSCNGTFLRGNDTRALPGDSERAPEETNGQVKSDSDGRVTLRTTRNGSLGVSVTCLLHGAGALLCRRLYIAWHGTHRAITLNASVLRDTLGDGKPSFRGNRQVILRVLNK